MEGKDLKFNGDIDLIGPLWEDRPKLKKGKVFVHDVKYAGKTSSEKLHQVREEMTKLGANHYLLTSLDDIAWLLNIRGNDVQNNPVVISNVVIALDKCYLFIDSSKLFWTDIIGELVLRMTQSPEKLLNIQRKLSEAGISESLVEKFNLDLPIPTNLETFLTYFKSVPIAATAGGQNAPCV